MQLLAAALLALGAGAASADRIEVRPAECLDDSPVAEVTSLAPPVDAVGPDGARRPLECGDVIRGCDTIELGGGARIGILSGDALWAEIDGPGSVRVDRTEAGLPSFDVRSGALRVVDTRTAPGAPVRLAGGGLAAEGAGGDGELVVREGAARLCARAGTFAVTAPGAREPLDTESGRCVEAPARGPVRVVGLPAEAVPIAGGGIDICLPAAAPAPVADRFDPVDVAAAPPPSGLLAPAPPGFERDPGDLIGGPAGGLGVIESPTTPGLPPGLPPGGAPPGGLPQ